MFRPGCQGNPFAYQPRRVAGEQYLSDLNFFASAGPRHYQEFIQAETVFMGRFNKVLLPDVTRYAWLSPYTGNMHNRRHFTQAALAQVAIAQFKANKGVFPRLIEPFVGSGQVFLNACCYGPSFNQGIPLFHQVIGGDLNPYVVAAYKVFRARGAGFAQRYVEYAATLDGDFVTAFKQRIAYLNEQGAAAATESDMSQRVGTAEFAVMSYIYVVNRCLRGSRLNRDRGVTATPNEGVNLDGVRQRELSALTSTCDEITALGRVAFICQDFEATCALAASNDIVFMDCPFPRFSRQVPKDAGPSVGGLQAAGTYGVGDDGGQLQDRIVAVTQKLLEQGTTVILCNFANPGLVRAYSNLLWDDTGIPVEDRRWFTFTYCSPSTTSEAYQLTILPGRGKFYLNDVPATLRQLWRQCGGDDNFEPPGRQEYFNTIGRLPTLNTPLPQPLDQALVRILPSRDGDEMSDFEAELDAGAEEERAEDEEMETDDAGG
ncbi:MAG TPA: DNA adenine methylase [Trebonia sp.]|nr:DNA adenine methylase [Trebonia sp.]